MHLDGTYTVYDSDVGAAGERRTSERKSEEVTGRRGEGERAV